MDLPEQSESPKKSESPQGLESPKASDDLAVSFPSTNDKVSLKI